MNQTHATLRSEKCASQESTQFMPNCNHDNGPGWLVASFSWRSPRFAHSSVPVEHAVNNVTLALISLQATAFPFPHSISALYLFVYQNFVH
jgi:hypothetical protein